MLVLSRKPGEQVVIGDNIRLTVVEVRGNRVKIGIEAPADVGVFRSELRDWQDANPAQPSATPAQPLRGGRPRLHKARTPVNLACTTVE